VLSYKLGIGTLGDLMPRTYLIFGDIESKLDVLRVECTKCDRKGRYSHTAEIVRGKSVVAR
jgi:hypothetical protein